MRRAIVAAVALVAALVPALAARAAPAIKLLNPSGYSATLVISDETDNDNAVHLVSWVKEVPVNPLVEFEFTSAAGTPNLTIDTTRVGSDTWEAFLSLSGITDGQYILRSRLYRDFTGPGTGTQIAEDEVNVTVNAGDVPPPPESNTVEIQYPSNGGSVGFFNPKGKPANLLVDGIASAGTAQVRGLYTTSSPGSAPDWKACGFARVPSSLIVRVRCTLEEGTGGAQVTALALIANDTPPPATPNAVGDATGDAHRVLPYVQLPQRVVLNPTAVQSEPSVCQVFVASTFDQAGRPIAAANLDVHAVGPDDQIQFGVIERTSSPQASVLTSEFQAPDRSHPSSRVAHNCGSGEPAEERQGDHNIPGANDPQHIESTAGTNDQGDFTFALRSTTVGATQIEAWVDLDDDDVLQASEISGGARIGWGQAPPPPSRSILLEPTSASATTGSCQRMVIAAKEGGNPLVAANVDVHAGGPNETVAFCVPGSDASVGRDPDQGSHIGNSDDAETRHLEGETDSTGRFVFGVTAAAEGTTAVTVWLDSSDDDALSGDEPSRLGQITWAVSGERSISINSSAPRVRKGKRVAIFGSIDGSAACSAGQSVKLKAKPVEGGRFRTIKSITTDVNGDYNVGFRVFKSRRYRTIAPPQDVCERTRSRIITVRVRR